MPRPRRTPAADPHEPTDAWSGAGLAPVVRGRGGNRTSDRVLAQLAAAICDLRLAPGRELAESELAATLGVSRTPLREAIARLVDLELVEVAPQVGTRVARIRPGAVAEAQYVRETLELAVYEQAAARGVRDARDTARMRALVELQREAAATHDLEAFFAADEAMHQQVYLLAGHPGAWEAVRRVKPQLDRVRRLSLPDADLLAVLLDEHAALVDALEAGDVARGTAVLRTHCRRVLLALPEMRAAHPEYFAP